MKVRNSILLGGLSIALLTAFTWINSGEKEKPAKDEYKVIKVNGKILLSKSGKNLTTGDIFSPETQLKFVTPQSRAAVISKLKGRFVLKPDSDNSGTNLLPAMNNIASRSGAILNQIDLQNHFNDNYLIIDQVKVKIGGETFPMNDKNFFYLQYEHDGETIRKKLDAEDGHMIIDKNELFKIDGKPIDTKNGETMALYYRKSEEKTSVKINTFSPVFPNKEELKVEIQVILDEYADKDNETKKEEITAYLNEFYGKPNKENLDRYLKEEFGL